MTDKTDKPDVVDSDCLEAFDHLYAYLNGELHDRLTLAKIEHHLGHCKSCFSRAQMERELNDENTLAKIEHHLGHCKSCFSRAQMERELNERIKKSGKDKTPESLKNRLRDLMDDI